MSDAAPIGEKAATPVYQHKLPSTSWQLLWWMISMMDDNQEVTDGWRARAARDMGKDRIWIGRCVEPLVRAGLIDAEPRRRIARVLVKNLVA